MLFTNVDNAILAVSAVNDSVDVGCDKVKLYVLRAVNIVNIYDVLLGVLSNLTTIGGLV